MNVRIVRLGSPPRGVPSTYSATDMTLGVIGTVGG